MESRSDEARASLAAVDDARGAMARRLRTPRWYWPATGLLYGGTVALWALPDSHRWLVAVGSLLMAGGLGAVIGALVRAPAVEGRSLFAVPGALAALAVFVAAVLAGLVLIVLTALGVTGGGALVLCGAGIAVVMIGSGAVIDAVAVRRGRRA